MLMKGRAASSSSSPQCFNSRVRGDGDGDLFLKCLKWPELGGGCTDHTTATVPPALGTGRLRCAGKGGTVGLP